MTTSAAQLAGGFTMPEITMPEITTVLGEDLMPGMITVRTNDSWFLPVGRIVDVRFAYYGHMAEENNYYVTMENDATQYVVRASMMVAIESFPIETVWYGIPVNVDTDSMIWFMAVVIDMEYTNGGIGDAYWATLRQHDLSDGNEDYWFACTAFEHVATGGI